MNKIIFDEIKSDNHARKGNLSISLPTKTKTLKTPIMLAEIKHGTDIDYLNNFIMNCIPQNFGGIIYRLSQARKFKHLQQNINYPTLDRYVKGYDIASWVKQNMLVLADPESENAYYSSDPDLGSLEGLPESYIEEVINVPKRKRSQKFDFYENFLTDILNKSYTYTLKFFVKEKTDAQTDFLIPPSTLIIPELPKSWNVCFEINSKAMEIAKTREGWITSAYFPLKVSVFEDDKIYKMILNYISSAKPPILVFKVIDPYILDNRNAAIQRMYFHKFLLELHEITLKNKIPVIWLNCDALGVFLTLIGADGFATPLDGYIEKVIVSPKSAYKPEQERGRYFHYSLLSFVSYGFILKLNQNNQPLPCAYGCCDEYNKKNLMLLPRQEKTLMCRRHYLNSLNGLLTEVKDGIDAGDTRTVMNKLLHSSCKNFYEILEGFSLPTVQSITK